MARNPSLPLSVEQLANVCAHSAALFAAMGTGDTVTLTYVKRDGSVSSSTGVVLPTVLGAESTLAVTVDTADKGPRTVNMSGILAVS